VLAAFLAHRLEEASGESADPALVKKLAVELYLEPKRAPDLENGRLRLRRLTRRWFVRGAFGRGTEKHARRALDAAGNLGWVLEVTERRRSRTDRAVGYTTARVLKTRWATGPMPLRGRA